MWRDLRVLLLVCIILMSMVVPLAMAGVQTQFYDEQEARKEITITLTGKTVDIVTRLVIPFFTTFLIGMVKKFVPKAVERVPSWAIPIVAVAIGASTGTVIEADPVLGSIAGLAGTGLHQIKTQFKNGKEPDEKA